MAATTYEIRKARASSRQACQTVEDDARRQQALWEGLSEDQREQVRAWVKANRADARHFPSIFQVLCLYRAERLFGSPEQDTNESEATSSGSEGVSLSGAR